MAGTMHKNTNLETTENYFVVCILSVNALTIEDSLLNIGHISDNKRICEYV